METELTVQQELGLLQDLQALDFQLKELQEHLGRIPDQISGFDMDLDENQSALEQANQSVEDQRQAQRRTEGEVGSLQEQLSKYRTQLMEVKTNKEYQAVLREIETIEQRISEREDRILELMLAMEEHLVGARALENQVNEKDAAIRQKKTEVESFSSRAENQSVELDGKRENLIGSMPSSLLARYRRISTARGGHVLAQIIDGSCQACNVVLRPQIIAEVKIAARIATCDACNRILYYSAD